LALFALHFYINVVELYRRAIVYEIH